MDMNKISDAYKNAIKIYEEEKAKGNIVKTNEFVNLLDKVAGENMTDLIAGKYLTTGHSDNFHKLPPKKQIEFIRNNIDQYDYDLCAIQNNISSEEQRGRVEAIMLAFENDMKIFVG